MLAALETVRDPELDEPITSLGFVASCTVSADGRGRGPAPAAHVLLRAELRVPDGRRRLRRGVRRGRACGGPRSSSRTTSRPTRSTAAWPPRPVSSRSFDGEAVAELRPAAGRLPAQGGAWPAPTRCAGHCWPRARTRRHCVAMTLGRGRRRRPLLERLRQRRAELGPARRRRRPAAHRPGAGARRSVSATLPLHLRRARVTRVSIEANSGICRGMLRHRYDDAEVKAEARIGRTD